MIVALLHLQPEETQNGLQDALQPLQMHQILTTHVTDCYSCCHLNGSRSSTGTTRQVVIYAHTNTHVHPHSLYTHSVCTTLNWIIDKTEVKKMICPFFMRWMALICLSIFWFIQGRRGVSEQGHFLQLFWGIPKYFQASWVTFTPACPGGLLRGHPIQIPTLISMCRNSGSTLSSSWVTELLTLSLRECPATLWRTLNGCISSCYF